MVLAINPNILNSFSALMVLVLKVDNLHYWENKLFYPSFQSVSLCRFLSDSLKQSGFPLKNLVGVGVGLNNMTT